MNYDITYRDGGDESISISCATCRVFFGKGAIPVNSTFGGSSSRVVCFSDHEGLEAEFRIRVSKMNVDTQAQEADKLEENKERNNLKGKFARRQKLRCNRCFVDFDNESVFKHFFSILPLSLSRSLGGIDSNF